MDAVAGRRIYFGHQSVGDNVIAGLEELWRERPETRFDLVHDRLGTNTKPHSKFEDFVRRLRDGRAAGRDVALMKLCYVDFDRATDPTAVFDAYRSMVREVREAFPALRLVHVTVPLTTSARGLRAALKRLLGRADRNAIRGRYNRRLRDAYGDDVFDLAAVESTHPDGRRETVEVEGKTWEALVPAYTNDGGHLNAQGRRIAAKALLAFLTTTP